MSQYLVNYEKNKLNQFSLRRTDFNFQLKPTVHDVLLLLITFKVKIQNSKLQAYSIINNKLMAIIFH